MARTLEVKEGEIAIVLRGASRTAAAVEGPDGRLGHVTRVGLSISSHPELEVSLDVDVSSCLSEEAWTALSEGSKRTLRKSVETISALPFAKCKGPPWA